MLNKEDYEQIDNLIMSAEAVCNAVSDYSSDLKRAYLESKKIDKCRDVSEIKNNLQTILEIDVDKLHTDIINDLDTIIVAKDYKQLLSACNLKGEISRGLADTYLDKDYINKAIEHIVTNSELQEKLINKYFKDLA